MVQPAGIFSILSIILILQLINSVSGLCSIELTSMHTSNIGENGEATPCGHFSIREYVSEMRKKDIRKCWPFLDISNQLPPLEAPQFQRWTCDNCLRRSNISDGIEEFEEIIGNANHAPIQSLGDSQVQFFASPQVLAENIPNETEISEPILAGDDNGQEERGQRLRDSILEEGKDDCRDTVNVNAEQGTLLGCQMEETERSIIEFVREDTSQVKGRDHDDGKEENRLIGTDSGKGVELTLNSSAGIVNADGDEGNLHLVSVMQGKETLTVDHVREDTCQYEGAQYGVEKNTISSNNKNLSAHETNASSKFSPDGSVLETVLLKLRRQKGKFKGVRSSSSKLRLEKKIELNHKGVAQKKRQHRKKASVFGTSSASVDMKESDGESENDDSGMRKMRRLEDILNSAPSVVCSNDISLEEAPKVPPQIDLNRHPDSPVSICGNGENASSPAKGKNRILQYEDEEMNYGMLTTSKLAQVGGTRSEFLNSSGLEMPKNASFPGKGKNRIRQYEDEEMNYGMLTLHYISELAQVGGTRSEFSDSSSLEMPKIASSPGKVKNRIGQYEDEEMNYGMLTLDYISKLAQDGGTRSEFSGSSSLEMPTNASSPGKGKSRINQYEDEEMNYGMLTLDYLSKLAQVGDTRSEFLDSSGLEMPWTAEGSDMTQAQGESSQLHQPEVLKQASFRSCNYQNSTTERHPGVCKNLTSQIAAIDQIDNVELRTKNQQEKGLSYPEGTIGNSLARSNLVSRRYSIPSQTNNPETFACSLPNDMPSRTTHPHMFVGESSNTSAPLQPLALVPLKASTQRERKCEHNLQAEESFDLHPKNSLPTTQVQTPMDPGMSISTRANGDERENVNVLSLLSDEHQSMRLRRTEIEQAKRNEAASMCPPSWNFFHRIPGVLSTGYTSQGNSCGPRESFPYKLMSNTVKIQTEERNERKTVLPDTLLSLHSNDPTAKKCTINRNPADFSLPEEGNEYMIGFTELKR